MTMNSSQTKLLFNETNAQTITPAFSNSNHSPPKLLPPQKYFYYLFRYDTDFLSYC